MASIERWVSATKHLKRMLGSAFGGADDLRRIAEMEWLISDIEDNGYAATSTEAEARPVPEFEGTATRDCGAG